MAESGAGGRPRVLFAIGQLGAGGSENQLCELVERLHGREIDATVLVGTADPGPRLERLHAAGVKVIEIGVRPSPSPLAVVRLIHGQWKALRAVRPDVVYAWLEGMTLFLTPLARLRRNPVVIRRASIGGAQIERIHLMRWAVRRAERLATLVTVNSSAVLEHAVQRGIERRRLRLIPNALADREPVPPPLPPPVRIGYLARMRPEKGHRRLLGVLSALPAEPEWRAKLGGGGPLLETLREEADRLGISGRIDFCGEVDGVSFWDDCHIALLLSDQEGSPNSLLEAARAARPLLATAVGGSVEVVDESAGFLVEPDDRAETAARLLELIVQPDLRDRLGQGARRVTMSRHDPATVCGQHLGVLRELLTTDSAEG